MDGPMLPPVLPCSISVGYPGQVLVDTYVCPRSSTAQSCSCAHGLAEGVATANAASRQYPHWKPGRGWRWDVSRRGDAYPSRGHSMSCPTSLVLCRRDVDAADEEVFLQGHSSLSKGTKCFLWVTQLHVPNSRTIQISWENASQSERNLGATSNVLPIIHAMRLKKPFLPLPSTQRPECSLLCRNITACSIWQGKVTGEGPQLLF